MFVILAVFIIGSALMCVTTTKIMRAATFMLFVLFGVAGIYFLLDYTFLGAAQISSRSDLCICRRRYDDLCVRHSVGEQAHPSGS